MSKDKIRILIAATLVLSVWATTELLVPIYKANRDASMIMVSSDQANVSSADNNTAVGGKSTAKRKLRATSDNSYDLAENVAQSSNIYDNSGTVGRANVADMSAGGANTSRKVSSRSTNELSGSAISSSSYRSGRASSNNGGSYSSFSGLIAKNTTSTASNPSILNQPQAAPSGSIDGGDPGGDPTGNPIPIPDSVLFTITLAFIYFIIKSRYKK